MADGFIAKSKIHGRGIFAARDFKKGEIIINGEGFNHSCEANTEVINGKYIVAKRIVKKGDELTANYLAGAKFENSKKFKCNCGSKNHLAKIIS